MLVKTRVKLQDHLGAAWLLVRVARNISKFPKHVVPILTSTVIECQRAELRKTAHEYATMLMHPDYRSKIAEEYKRKIENIVRKPEFKASVKQVLAASAVVGAFKGALADSRAANGADAAAAAAGADDDDQGMSPCPFCRADGPAYELECSSCRSTVPYCIASGKRLRLGDWAQCPSCHFPALASELTSVLDIEGACPMCAEHLSSAVVVKLSDPLATLQKEGAATTDEAAA